MRKINGALSGVRRLGADTNPVVYLVQATQPYFPVVDEVFRRVTGGQITVVTSMLTLMESLVLPYSLGNAHLAQTFFGLLLRTNNVETIAVDETVAAQAADMRARYRLKPADALQIATAIVSKCDAFLTNDSDFNRVREIPVLVVGELEL